jgi:signal transduction histidine kinase
MKLRALVQRHGLDALIVLDFVYAEFEIWLEPVPGRKAALMASALLATLPLLARHRYPLFAALCPFVALVSLPFIASTAASHSDGGLFSYLVAFWVFGFSFELRTALVGLALGYAAAVAVIQLDPGIGYGENISFFVLMFAVWIAARAMRARERRADALEEQARSAVAEERTRIARELHDVIAHCVSVMTVQAGAARMLLGEDPARAREPLLAVEETGRQTLGEMRRLLGMLRHDAAPGLNPQPGLADLGALLERCERAGLPVELKVEGEPEPLAPGTDLAAYRVVQEALTNAIKHAGPARARVTVRYDRDALALEISDDGRAHPGNGGGGHGLVGMRERVSLYGGEFHAGPRAGGGYTVRAQLPREPRP